MRGLFIFICLSYGVLTTGLIGASEVSPHLIQDRVLCFCQPIVDHVVHLDLKTIKQHSHFLGTSELINHEDLEELKKQWKGELISKSGGSGSNTLKALASLGHHCLLVGSVGDDPWGSYFEHEMFQKHVMTDLRRKDKPTAQVLSMVDPQGGRTMRISMGAAKEFREEDILESHFNQVGLVHFEGYQIRNLKAMKKAMRLAKEKGCSVSLDLGTFQLVDEYKNDFKFLIQNYVDYLFGNIEEAGALVDCNEGSQLALSLNDWAATVAIHNGEEGFWVSHKGQVNFYPSYSAEAVVDTTGAGDLFTAGFLHGCMSGWSLELSSQFAGLLGALVVQMEGAELPSEVWRTIRENFIYKGVSLPPLKKRISSTLKQL